MTEQTALNGSTPEHADGRDPLEHDGVTGTSITRMTDCEPLTPAALDHRRLIHPEMDDPVPADIFRELRLGLRFRSDRDNPVILVTGIAPGCGTTFVAKNLASAIAFEETRTALLIDCNLRRPALQRDFSIDAQGGGLIEFLRKPAIGLPNIIYPTGVPRLRLIPAGHAPRAGGEFFASYRMRALVDVLRNRYPDRSLVLDAPPAVGSPDARLLAELSDIVLLVAGDGMHRAEAITDAARAFPPAKFGGIVFNQRP
jgi:protein-tyrosine kinase